MSHRQRMEARERAFEKGVAARKAGKPASANPYKPLGHARHPGGTRHGEWSLFPAWASGYRSVQAEETPPEQQGGEVSDAQ